MTESQFEVFDIHCGDFIRNLAFIQKQSRDPFICEMLEDMINNVQQYRKVIAEPLDLLV